MGCDQPAAELAPLLSDLRADDALPPSQQRVAQQLAAAWAGCAGPPPLALLGGGDRAARRAALAAAAALLGQPAQALDAALLPSEPEALAELALRCSREARLGRGALLIEADDLAGEDHERAAALRSLAQAVEGLVALSGATPDLTRTAIHMEVGRPSPAEQRGLWLSALGPGASPETAGRLAASFSLGGREVRAACAAAPDGDPTALWAASQAQSRPRLDGLARRIDARAGWDSLAFPAPVARSLRAIIAAARQRATVHEGWGFAARGERGLGISALFAGASGTGKTSAAELVAGELGLDLYQVDLSAVVSKYIGETEKQLRRIFDAAEAGGAVLLFDEADALFGRRSEVKDSRDRYANLEVSYLLQRVEQYRGLAILTSNARQALDGAFLRRLRFVVPFAFPDAAQRELIWRRAFPPGAPLAALDYARLARLSLAGGNISSIALGAAYLAAEAGAPIDMGHLAEAARAELAKLERPESEADSLDRAESSNLLEARKISDRF
ncbi:ATP-binding protein [Oscillochloris sp. ZM17-4]|uniref:ATP-binding protein n=1 Tax=Oscillochloris sp. ZM17-4 TaxID=2866714 RepID=UPI001C72A379|nr:ATP-binding protein [Oscillochloris sp. ZM17-4]MBX0328460.1 ATP-binding protein [Oscillochloris sp. ZM17-4]